MPNTTITRMPPLTAEQAALFDAHVAAVAIMVRSYCRRKNILRDYEDLNQAGLLAMADCARHFDPSRGFKFCTFYRSRVLGAVCDELRRFDLLTRSHRRQMQAEGVQQPTEKPFSTLDGKRELYQHIDQNLAAPSQVVTPLELQEEIDRVLEGFFEQDRVILLAYYGEHERLRVIGQRLGLSESRVSQLLKAIRERMRERHGKHALPDKVIPPLYPENVRVKVRMK